MVQNITEYFKAPKDKFYFVFIILIFHGIGTLLPWNMLITANSYFVDYKLNVSNSSSALDNYRNNFLSYLGIASKVPNIILQFINLFSNSAKCGSLITRICITLLIQSAIFGITIVLAVINSTQWPEIFFWVTMISAAAINMANGVYQGCVYGTAADLPMIYTNAVTFGMNLSGTVVALLMIMSIAISPNPKEVAIYFFSSAIVWLLICLATFIILRKNKFYNFYIDLTQNDANIELSTTKSSQLSIENEKVVHYNSTSEILNNNEPPVLMGIQVYVHVLKRTWVQLLNIILIYFITFIAFPELQANVEPLNNIMKKDYFAPVTCFLLYPTIAMIGNLMAQKIVKPGPKYMTIWILLRIAFIPFFLYCNYLPQKRKWSVLIKNDYAYIGGSILFALTAGYLSSLCMMYAPRCVEPKYAKMAGMMAAVSILIGILAGINFALLNSTFVVM